MITFTLTEGTRKLSTDTQTKHNYILLYIETMACTFVHTNTFPNHGDGQKYLDDFLLDGMNFFNSSNFHMERTYGTKATADVDISTYPEEGEFVDYCDETHSIFKPSELGVMYGPRDPEITKQLIGRKGCGFIKITQDAGVDFIWHNRDSNTIHIEGPPEKIDDAMTMISKRIAYFIRRAKKKKKFVYTNAWDHHVPAQFY